MQHPQREGRVFCAWAASAEVVAGAIGGSAACEIGGIGGVGCGGGGRHEGEKHGVHAVAAAMVDAGSSGVLPHFGVFAGARASWSSPCQCCL